MTTLSEAKVMGGIGAILVILTAIPDYGFVLGIAGLVLILVAISVISREVNDRRIFSDMLMSVILAIVALIILGIAVAAAVFSLIGLGNFTGPDFVPGPNVQPGDFIAFFVALIPALLAIWVLFIVSAVFIRRSLDSMGKKLNVRLFGTAGLLYLIGAATIIIGVGIILIFVSEILLAIAFFTIETAAPSQNPPLGTGADK